MSAQEVLEPICYVVVELREGDPWIEDGPFSRDEAVQLATEHTEQMSEFVDARYAAAAVYLIDSSPASAAPTLEAGEPSDAQVEAAHKAFWEHPDITGGHDSIRAALRAAAEVSR